MVIGVDGLWLAQEDGNLPTTLAAGSAAGESGLSVRCDRFQGGLHISGTLRQHLICFQLAQACFDCRMGGRSLRHEPPAGSLAICPAGIDCAADADRGLDAILITIDPRPLLLAAAEDSALESQLIERLAGRDQRLLDLALTLASESASDYPNGPLFWNEIASAFINRLVACHTSTGVLRTRGTLSNDVLGRLRDYILAHVREPIQVATLAKLAGRSPFHFSRVFTRSVGVSPHRYVVHLRLQRALELVRGGRRGLAEIAAQTGFADQSHLWRWVRRVHGVSLTELVALPEREQHKSS
jgi:AraC family transcriptional regulator